MAEAEWLQNLLGPSQEEAEQQQKQQEVKATPAAAQPAAPPTAKTTKQKTPAQRWPRPAAAPVTDPWKRLLTNIKALRPELLNAMKTVQMQGAAIIQGENQFFLGRGSFLTEKEFEVLVSVLYFHVILNKTTEGTKIQKVFNELRLRSARIRDTGTSLRLTKSKYINDADWDQIKLNLLEPNKDEVLRLLQVAREELGFLLSLSRMAEVVGIDSGASWDELGGNQLAN